MPAVRFLMSTKQAKELEMKAIKKSNKLIDQKGVRSLCEAVADIAQLAGQKGFYSGDSRADVSEYIRWAIEFEEFYKGVKWGEDVGMDYIDEIEKFAEDKMKNFTEKYIK